MVLAYHVIVGMYGFWLPNDERGSWSNFIGSWELLRFGTATTVDVSESLAKISFGRARRDEAKASLKYPPVRLTGQQAKAVGEGFGEYARKLNLAVYACAILPEHDHLVVARHRLKIEQVVIQLKGAATRQLVAQAMHPLAAHATRSGRPPKACARGEWKVFLDSAADMQRSIYYVRGNPEREGKPRQTWRFEVPYRGDRCAKRSAARRG